MTERLKLAELNALKIGDRVAFPDGAESYPSFWIDGRIEGTVVENDPDDMLVVKCDTHYPALDEWDNVIQVCLYSEEEVNHCLVRTVTLRKEVTAEGITLPAGTVCDIEQTYPAEGDMRATLDLIEPVTQTLFWMFTDDVEGL